MRNTYAITRMTIFYFVVAAQLAACNNPAQNNPNGQSKTENNANGRNDAWGYAGYGGGGAMFYPAVSAFNPDLAFVACDMTGSFVTYNGGESWRMFNLRGPVHFFTLDPLDSNTVYANSIALFKSTDKGKTWKVVYPSATDITAVISKGDHANEILVTKDSTARQVQALAIDPSNSKKLYAAISIDKKTGFYTSSDGGDHWKKESELAAAAQNIFIVPSSPQNNRTIYIATSKGIVTNEAGGNWKMNPSPGGVKKLTTYSGGYDSVQKKFSIYAISGLSYFNPDGDQSGIYITSDGGKTWENRQQGILVQQSAGAGMPEWRTIATSNQNPSVVYVSYNNLTRGDTTAIGVAKSEDYGVTWKLVWKDWFHKGNSGVSENFTSGWLNERFGPSWGENPFSIGVSPVDPGVCYATDFGRTIKTGDGGNTWKQVYTRKEGNGWISRGLEVTTSYNVVTDPFDTSHVFICNTDIGLMESTDGRSWKSATQNNGVPREWINSTYWLTFDPEVKGKAWAVMSANHDLPRPKMWRRTGVGNYKGGILTTDNAGKTWTPVSTPLGQAAFTHVLIDPSSKKDARTLFACAFGKGVYKSVDGGKTWQLKNKGLEGAEPFAWRIIRRDTDGVLFLIVSRRSERGEINTPEDGALYRSMDGGETWLKMKLPEGTNAPTSILPDRDSPSRLILSAWGKVNNGGFSADTGGGIFISDDDGETWKQVEQKDQHIHDITFDVLTKTYYACGFNSSAYRSADKGETWQRLKGYNFKWGKRVEPDPVHPGKVYIVTFGGGIWYGPDTGDNNAVEDIVTPVLSYK